MSDPERTRTHEWSDPMQVADLARRLDGRELLQGFMDGTIVPPIGSTLDFTFAAIGDGVVEARMVPQEFHFNPIGFVHGGIAATLLDTVTGCAVHSQLSAGTGYTTLSITVNYVRPMTVDTGEVIARGEVTSLGRRVATAQGVIEDGDGRTIATATATCLILQND